jgi:hypothetical protein
MSLPSPAPQPPVYAVPEPITYPTPTSLRSPSRRRTTAGILLIVAVVLAGVSLGTSWWTISVNDGPDSGSIYFLPGNSVSSTENGVSSSQTYTSTDLNETGTLFQSVFYAVLGVLVLSALGAVFALVTAFHRRARAGWGTAVVISVVVALALALVSVALVPAVEPSLFSKDNPSNICGEFQGTGDNSPCTTYWGSITTSHGTITWGADLGWYTLIAALVFVVAALALWFAARKEPWTREIEYAQAPGTPTGWAPIPGTAPGYPASPYSPGGGYPGYAPPGPPGVLPPTTRPPQEGSRGPDWWACPVCRTPNAIQDATCHRCGAPRPP